MRDSYETLPYRKYKVLTVRAALLIKKKCLCKKIWDFLILQQMGTWSASWLIYIRITVSYLDFFFLIDISIVLEYFKEMKGTNL